MLKSRFYVNARAISEREQAGTVELLLQQRQKPGQPRRLEFPGGQIDPFEGILAALTREVREETGLKVVRVLDDTDHQKYTSAEAAVECLQPAFVYQTTRGPVDSVGFHFRVHAEGTLTGEGDEAGSHQWFSIEALRARLEASSEDFDWLTQAALAQYLRSR